MHITRRAFCRAFVALPLLDSSPKRLLCFGDSITAGAGASTPAAAYANLIGAALGRHVDNRAIGASRIAEQLHDAIRPAVVDRNDVVLFLTGYNDVRAGTPLADYQQQLDAALTTLRATAALVAVGTCLRMTPAAYMAYGPQWNHGSDAAVTAYNASIATTAAAHGCRLATMEDYNPWNTTDDLVHPNDMGHRQIAQAMLAALQLRLILPLVAH